ncbi:SusC/RagA family TonB-linked outer membrane protein [Mucilaginibacter sp.]|uniref:SusC/RagA family TonB-linked outer membrane protein n=1 Tax=Mucilaginibacter sp. TaxID=1882438 RepID=UPI00261111BC|nr:SusC/RagA family TonB-linked outer membrane protein [Mucilaginibacter sp.]MDB4924227.1 TonB-dependent receptor plug [Mucilaginibacter sp.]
MKKNDLLIRVIMRASFLALSSILICSNLLLAGSSSAQITNKISISFTRQKLNDALNQLSNTTHVQIGYDSHELGIGSYQIGPEIFRSSSIETVLKELLKFTDISYKIVGQGIVLVKRSDPVKIHGLVTDDKDEPLPGVTITVKGVSTSTATDNNGVFNIIVADTTARLTFTYVGFTSQEVKAGNQASLHVRLTPNQSVLQEVVVTALNIKRETKSLTFSRQQVNADNLAEVKSPNLVNALSGKIAGVQVIPSGFNTGSARVIIRGNNSLTGNNQPLFVVDGMPIDNSPGDSGSLDYGNNAADINPNDIESLEVLKGPNAAALYGSRAANGVILITTKKGSGQFKVTFNSNWQFQKLTEFPEYQNAYGVGTSFYIDNTHTLPVANVNYRSWGSPMLGQPYVALDGKVKPYLPHPNNVKDFYNTAHLITNSIAVEGGNKLSNYRMSYTNYTGNSVVNGLNDNNSHTIDLRLLNTLGKAVTLDTKITYLRNKVNNRQYGNSNGRNPTNLYTQMARTTDLAELIPYQDPVTGLEIGTHRNFSNPYWVINKNPNEDIKDRILTTFSPEVKIAPGIKFTGRLGADIYWRKGYEFNDIGSIIAGNPDGYLRTFNTDQANLNLEGFFSINKKWRNFSFIGILGASSFSSNYENRGAAVNSLLQPGLINLSNAKEFPTVTQNILKKKINSTYGSLSVGFHNYAFIDVTGRNDWSSTLPRQNNSYFYPSFGGSLILNELFNFKDNIISLAKLRSSIAAVGNDSDPYQLSQTYSFNGFFNGATLASLSTKMNNPDLKPERTSSFEYGFDLGLFKNRVMINATHYSSSTTNQIITAQLPTSSGYQQRIYNAGEISNWGNELSINATVFRNKRFNWNTQLNFSNNKSLVKSLIPGVDRFVLNNNSSYIYVYAEVGKPYAYLRGLGVARDAQGHMLIDDGGGLLTKNNDMPFGTASPDWLGGFGNTFSYGPFTLYALIDIKKGGVMYSGSYSKMLVNGVSAETLYGRDGYYKHSIILGETGSELTGGAMWDAYYANGKKNTTYISPQSYEYARPNYAEFVMFDASYVKLREVSAGYNLPAKLLTHTPIKTARVSAVGRNLAILYRKTPKGIDPESSSTSGNGQGIENGSLPPNATYGFNINLTF